MAFKINDHGNVVPINKDVKMKSFVKKIFCHHRSITTKTEVKSVEPLFMVSSLIQCSDCGKTFPQHPNANCCYINHLHNEIIQRQLQMERLKQPYDPRN